MIRFLLASAALAALAAPACAQTVVPTPAFDSVELEGGGHVTIKHGDVQRVTIVKGSTQYTRIGTEMLQPRKLKIDACNENCPQHYDLEIVIETPSIAAVAISGGGHIETAGAFPGQHAVTAAIEGGGHVDLRSIDADNATAAVEGGGHIELRAEKHLTAAVDGGGHITYWGSPEVTEAVNGGGEVSRGS
ncbi:MAG: GIN domain-containing protein [Rhizomicrobium sp.]